MRVGVLIADDHRLVREGLGLLLRREPGFELVAQAGDGRTAARLCKQLRPDVAVMDIAMPELGGIEATRRIVREVAETKVVALSMYADLDFVKAMLDAGASGYLLKCGPFEEVAHCLRIVASGRIYLSPAVAGVVVEDYKNRLNGHMSTISPNLTPREREVIQLLAEGKKTVDIASLLHVSVKTVESHRKRVMEKLDLHSIAQLTKYAVRERLTSLDY